MHNISNLLICTTHDILSLLAFICLLMWNKICGHNYMSYVNIFAFIYLNKSFAWSHNDRYIRVTGNLRYNAFCRLSLQWPSNLRGDFTWRAFRRQVSRRHVDPKGWIQRLAGAISAKIIREGSPYLTMQEERRKGIEIDNSSVLNLRAARPPAPHPPPGFVKVWKDEKHEKAVTKGGRGATSVLVQ